MIDEEPYGNQWEPDDADWVDAHGWPEESEGRCTAAQAGWAVGSEFIRAAKFSGPRPGMVFKRGHRGIGIIVIVALRWRRRKREREKGQ